MANQTSVHHHAAKVLRVSHVEISHLRLSWIPWLIGIALGAAICDGNYGPQYLVVFSFICRPTVLIIPIDSLSNRVLATSIIVCLHS
jgi:hypothetical protein